MYELKMDLKARAAEIRQTKSEVKEEQRKNEPTSQATLAEMRQEYRYRHVAYSLARGRMREQIESKVRKGNELNAEILGRYAEAYRQHQAILKGTLSRGAPDPDKLYVLVDDTLPKTYAGIQATHAVAEFLRANPQTGWKNGTLVVLKADLRTIARYGRNLSWTAFREPDLGNRLTAVAAFKPNDVSLRYFSLL